MILDPRDRYAFTHTVFTVQVRERALRETLRRIELYHLFGGSLNSYYWSISERGAERMTLKEGLCFADLS